MEHFRITKTVRVKSRQCKSFFLIMSFVFNNQKFMFVFKVITTVSKQRLDTSEKADKIKRGTVSVFLALAFFHCVDLTRKFQKPLCNSDVHKIFMKFFHDCSSALLFQRNRIPCPADFFTSPAYSTASS